MDEVVVTALGIKREEKALGYATQNLTSESLTTVRDGNIVNALSGKIAGVSITNSSGAVGSDSRIVIRGISTISGGTQPLIVVDGVVMDNISYGDSNSGGGNSTPNGIADLNQDDIESINVLKGGAASALYGMRGSNGVLVVTTKTGQQSTKLGVNIASSVSFENVYILPDYQNSYGQGSSSTYFEFVDGVTGHGGVDESWGPALDSGLEFIQWNSVNGEALPWVSQPDNIKSFFETGITTNNNVSFSKGGDGYSGRLSIGLTDQKGVLHNTDLKKYNIGGRVDFDLSDNVAGGALEVTVNYCSADFDLILYTAAGSYVQYILGTASCPEEDQLSGLSDGSYFLVVDLYDNPFSTLNTGQPMPITLTLNQEHFPDTGTTIVHDGYTTDSSSGLQAVATLDVVGGYNYTITPL
ncbi:TonB-dependent receptor plug domain-containing protein [Flavobacteriaceae bacterium]|nr:TonB-dependent receptor plug domain-containing protein [Flavobacteriaceae bacterium]